MRLQAVTLWLAAIVCFVLSCAGPQPLSTAICPADERAYLDWLNAENANGRTAFFKWMAEERNLDLAAVEKRDLALSTTRNPFDAYKDPVAVGRGAVLYKWHCARCHGDDARGRGPSALPDHPPKDYHSIGNRITSTLHRGAPRRWFKSISEGYGDTVSYPDGPSPAMPPFGDMLAREQIWLVVTYLQSLDAYAPKSTQPSGESHPGNLASTQKAELHRVTQ